MTVGELVYQIATKDGYNPALPAGLTSSLQNIAETYQKVFDNMREPLKTVTSMVEQMQPQLQALSKMQLPRIPDLYSPSFIPSSFYDDENQIILPALTRPVQEVRIVNPEDIAVAPARQAHKYVTASYQLPGNAQWGLLKMQFIDGHFVRVSYPGMEPEKFDFKDMGFMNERTARPDMKWELLRLLASHGGSLTKEHWDRRFHRNIKYELAEGLRQFFGMTTSPIPRYTKRDGYATLFILRGER